MEEWKSGQAQPSFVVRDSTFVIAVLVFTLPII